MTDIKKIYTSTPDFPNKVWVIIFTSFVTKELLLFMYCIMIYYVLCYCIMLIAFCIEDFTHCVLLYCVLLLYYNTFVQKEKNKLYLYVNLIFWSTQYAYFVSSAAQCCWCCSSLFITSTSLMHGCTVSVQRDFQINVQTPV